MYLTSGLGDSFRGDLFIRLTQDSGIDYRCVVPWYEPDNPVVITVNEDYWNRHVLDKHLIDLDGEGHLLQEELDFRLTQRLTCVVQKLRRQGLGDTARALETEMRGWEWMS